MAAANPVRVAAARAPAKTDVRPEREEPSSVAMLPRMNPPASARSSAAQTPPPVNLAVLQGYSRGSNSIVGTTHFSKEGTAYCAPDVPYVNWYVAQLNSPRRPAYAVLLSRYTRTAPIGKDGTFTCTNIARGRYTVWIEGERRVGGGFVADPVVRDDAMNSTGQVSETTTTAAARNGDKAALGS